MGNDWHKFDDDKKCHIINQNKIFDKSTQYVYNLFYEKKSN